MGLKGNDEFPLFKGRIKRKPGFPLYGIKRERRVPFQGRIKRKPGFPLYDEFPFKEGSKGNLGFLCMGFKGNDEFPLFPFNNNSSKTYKNKRASLLISNEQG